jgi:hypothetical protein
MAAVAADVDESTQLTVSGSGHDDRDVARDRGEKASGLLELVSPPDVLPRRREDSLAFELEEDRIRVPRGRERPAFFERMLEGGRVLAAYEVCDDGPDCRVSQDIVSLNDGSRRTRNLRARNERTRCLDPGGSVPGRRA